MDIEKAKTKLSNSIYEASGLFEELESEGRLIGNGHHIRQDLCEFAIKLLEERWRNNENS